MKRRDFLTTSAGLAGALLPVVGRTQSKPCPPSSISASGGTSATTVCAPGDAEADWVARSTGAGVVWAHDFRNAAEFTNFHSRDYGWKYAGGSWQYDPTIPGGLESSGVAGWSTLSRVEGAGIPGTRGAAIVATVPDGFPDYPNGTYSVSGSGGSVDTYFPDRPMENWHSGKCKFERRVAMGTWLRPFAGLGSGNGLGQPDLGVQRGLVTGRTWNASSAGQFGNFRGGFYGHSDYWGTGGSTAAEWDGNEFYLQIRIRFSAGRFGYIDGATSGPYGTLQTPRPGRVYAVGGKLFWIADNKSNDSNVITVSGGNQTLRNHPDIFQGAGTPFEMYTGRPSETLIYPHLGPTGYVNGRVEPGGPYDACDFDTNRAACWLWPEDEWVTLLFWVKPGHSYVQAKAIGSVSGTTLTVTQVLQGYCWTSSRTAGMGAYLGSSGARVLSQLSGTPGGVGTYQLDNPYNFSAAPGTQLHWPASGYFPDDPTQRRDNYFRVYMATQSMIDAARNNGQTPQYVDLFKMPDGVGRWWYWADPSIGVPRGQFCFAMFNAYMNNTPSVVPFTQSITQVIFAKQFIPCPQV